MAAQHGGFRKGTGRPKGSRNRATIAREARQREALATARAENANLSAVDYLLQVLRDPTTPPGRRTEVAKFVAPSSRVPSEGEPEPSRASKIKELGLLPFRIGEEAAVAKRRGRASCRPQGRARRRLDSEQTASMTCLPRCGRLKCG